MNCRCEIFFLRCDCITLGLGQMFRERRQMSQGQYQRLVTNVTGVSVADYETLICDLQSSSQGLSVHCRCVKCCKQKGSHCRCYF
jgi:hypothetical protein